MSTPRSRQCPRPGCDDIQACTFQQGAATACLETELHRFWNNAAQLPDFNIQREHTPAAGVLFADIDIPWVMDISCMVGFLLYSCLGCFVPGTCIDFPMKKYLHI